MFPVPPALVVAAVGSPRPGSCHTSPATCAPTAAAATHGQRDEPGDDVDDRDGDDEDTDAKPPRRWRRTILEWLGVIGGGIAIALLVEAFLIQAFWIPSPSMEPTLDVGDRVLVNKLSYKFHDVHRGDVVVFERPPSASTGEDGEIKDLIKRVIAVGGDTSRAGKARSTSTASASTRTTSSPARRPTTSRSRPSPTATCS